MSSQDSLGELGLGEGGLLRRFETAAHLTRLPWQILTVWALTWVPLMALSLLGQHLEGRADPLIRDPGVHVRLLIAAPVFLFLDQIFPLVCRIVLKQLMEQSFIPAAARPLFLALHRRVRRLSDSWLPEIVLALCAVVLGVGLLLGVVPASGLERRGGLSPAQVWYAVADVPLFQFLFWRSLWRWALWVRLLVGLSRIDLDLVACHPDCRGGISFLRLPSIGYCAMLLFAISSVLCAEWAGRFTSDATLTSFTPLLALFASAGTLIAFGPLLLFVPHLLRARVLGRIGFGDLAADYGRRFRAQWVEKREREGRLRESDVGSLSDLGVTYQQAVDKLQVLLFDRVDLFWLLTATLAPLVPLMLAQVPAEDWLDLVRLLTGGKLL